MRLIPLTMVLIALPTVLASQEAQPASPAPLGSRKVTAIAGIGNAMGWFGIQGERYFARERFSVFAGLGYTLADVEGDPSGATFAVGARGFTAGLKHRGFLELSISQIAIRAAVFDDGDRYYGPGLQAGYQFVQLDGLARTRLRARHSGRRNQGSRSGRARSWLYLAREDRRGLRAIVGQEV